MRRTPSRLRGTALIAAGALALHELRYLVVAPAAEQAGAGHGYLPLAGLACALILALAFAQLVAVVARARRTGAGAGEEHGLGFRSVWLMCACALAGIFIAQELLEAALAPGRHGVLAGAFDAGAWVSVPLAVLLGAIVALALVGARAAVVAAARRGRRARPLRRRARGRTALPCAHRPRLPSLASHLSGRAPPPAA